MKRFTRCRVLNLGAEGIYYLCIVRVKTAVYHNESMRIGLTEQIFRLVNLIRSIHRYKHGAELGRCPEGNIPRRKIGCPYRYLRARLYAQRNERACKAVNILSELSIGACVIESRILEAVLIGKFLGNSVKNL